MSRLRSALVTGGSGFIGSALVRRLLRNQVDVICLVRPGRGIPRDLEGVRTIEVDSFRLERLKTALADVSAEVVFNLASYGVKQQDRDPDQLVEGNVTLVANLLRATHGFAPKRFIHAGSCSEYGFPPQPGTAIDEDTVLAPTSLYGAAKAAATVYGTALARELGMPFTTLRLFGVYGTGESPVRIIPYLIHKLQRNEAVDLTAGEQVRDLLNVDDVVEAFVTAAETDGLQNGRVYNVCSGKGLRIRQVGEQVAVELGKPQALLEWGKRAYRSDEPMWLVGNSQRFSEATGWRPRITLDAGIRQMIAASTDAVVGAGRHAL